MTRRTERDATSPHQHHPGRVAGPRRTGAARVRLVAGAGGLAPRRRHPERAHEVLRPTGVLARWVVAVVLVVALAACGGEGSGGGGGGSGGGGGNGSGQGGGPYADGALVLQVSYTGGFLSPQMITGRLPVVSVFGDGRVISEGPVPAIHPGPALPNVQVTRIGRDDVRDLVQQALDAGVGDTADLGSPPVADVPSTRFTVFTGLETITREVYALSVSDGDGSGLTDEQVSARAELSTLRDRLTDLTSGVSEPYTPSAVAALVSPYVPEDDPQLVQPALAWPGPALPGDVVAQMADLSCVVATGDQAAAVLQVAADANTLTPWVADDGSRWSVIFR